MSLGVNGEEIRRVALCWGGGGRCVSRELAPLVEAEQLLKPKCALLGTRGIKILVNFQQCLLHLTLQFTTVNINAGMAGLRRSLKLEPFFSLAPTA